jgi:hypothetical protein
MNVAVFGFIIGYSLDAIFSAEEPSRMRCDPPLSLPLSAAFQTGGFEEGARRAIVRHAQAKLGLFL